MTDPIATLARHNPVDETAVSGARRDARGAAELARIMDTPVPRWIARDGRLRRTASVLAGVAGTAAAVGVVAELFLHTTPGGRVASPPAGTWGMQMLVRVSTTGGDPPLDQATATAVRVIQARMDARHWDGATVTTTAPGSVRVTVPWAQAIWQITGILDSPRLEVLDAKAVIATSSHDPLWYLRTMHGPPGSSWYLLSRDGRWLLDGPRRLPIWPATRAGRRIRPPVGVSLVYSGLGQGYLVVRESAVQARGDQITSVSNIGSGRLAVTTTVPVTTPAWLLQGTLGGRSRVLATTGAAVSATTLIPMMVSTDGAVAAMEGQLAGGGLDADLNLIGIGSYGQSPGRGGERITPPPRVRLALTQSGVGRSDIRRALIEPVSGAAVWVGQAHGETAAVTSIPASDNLETMLGCQLGPDHRVILRCRLNRGVWTFGRVAPEVSAVRARAADGTTTTGVVQNGWFAVARPRRDVHMTVEALDAHGRVLATLP